MSVLLLHISTMLKVGFIFLFLSSSFPISRLMRRGAMANDDDDDDMLLQMMMMMMMMVMIHML